MNKDNQIPNEFDALYTELSELRFITGNQDNTIDELNAELQGQRSILGRIGSNPVTSKSLVTLLIDMYVDSETKLIAERKQTKLQREVISRVIGWREHDRPEGFCRATAEMIADDVRVALTGSGSTMKPSDQQIDHFFSPPILLQDFKHGSTEIVGCKICYTAIIVNDEYDARRKHLEAQHPTTLGNNYDRT